MSANTSPRDHDERLEGSERQNFIESLVEWDLHGCACNAT